MAELHPWRIRMLLVFWTRDLVHSYDLPRPPTQEATGPALGSVQSPCMADANDGVIVDLAGTTGPKRLRFFATNITQIN